MLPSASDGTKADGQIGLSEIAVRWIARSLTKSGRSSVDVDGKCGRTLDNQTMTADGDCGRTDRHADGRTGGRTERSVGGEGRARREGGREGGVFQFLNWGTGGRGVLNYVEMGGRTV